MRRHFIAVQFGGQTAYSFHSNLGFGLNENADNSDPNDRAIYGIHSGFIGLIGKRQLALELGLNPTTYFYKSTTFVNLIAWTGIRICPKKMEVLFLAIGYTPRLYYTYSEPD